MKASNPKASNLKAGNPKASNQKRRITKHELRRRFKEHPLKTLKYLRDHKGQLPEKLRDKIEKFLEKHDHLNDREIAAVDEALATDPNEEIIIVETDQEASEGATDDTITASGEEETK